MRRISLFETVSRRGHGPNRLPDTLKLKLGLERLGYYPAKDSFTPGADDDFWSGLERYQSHRGLEVDGMAMPNGPTVTALNQDLQRTLHARSLIGNRSLETQLPGEIFTANRRMARSLARSSAVSDLPTFMVAALRSPNLTAPAEVADLLFQAHGIAPKQAGRLRVALEDYLDDADVTRFDDALRGRLGPSWDEATSAAAKEREARELRRQQLAATESDEESEPDDALAQAPSEDTSDERPEQTAPPPDIGDISNPRTRLDLPDGTLSPEYRDEIAKRESNIKGYIGVNIGKDGEPKAWGRYQLSRDGLKDIKMKGANGNWTGKYGVHSDEDFLNNPEVQEQVFEDYTRRNDDQLRKEGAKAHIGQQIEGIKAPFTIAEGGLAAAAHRRGATRVKEYLDYLESKGWKSNIDKLPEDDDRRDAFHIIETRLREFERVSARKP